MTKLPTYTSSHLPNTAFLLLAYGERESTLLWRTVVCETQSVGESAPSYPLLACKSRNSTCSDPSLFLVQTTPASVSDGNISQPLVSFIQCILQTHSLCWCGFSGDSGRVGYNVFLGTLKLCWIFLIHNEIYFFFPWVSCWIGSGCYCRLFSPATFSVLETHIVTSTPKRQRQIWVLEVIIQTGINHIMVFARRIEHLPSILPQVTTALRSSMCDLISHEGGREGESKSRTCLQYQPKDTSICIPSMRTGLIRQSTTLTDAENALLSWSMTE